ncbi:MAG: helix-turn-helix transcriptional regulator [Thermomicrobiales bacterium]
MPGTRDAIRRRSGKAVLPPAAHAILGLIAIDHGTGHGYDLARHFAPDAPLAQVIRLEPGMLYHHLKQLERAGWVTADREAGGNRPPRRVHAVTDAGWNELRRWLAEPVAQTREIRLAFLLKLYFARRLDSELAARLISGQRDVCLRLVDSLSSQIDDLRPVDGVAEPDREFARSVLELRLAQTRAARDWLDGIGG